VDTALTTVGTDHTPSHLGSGIWIATISVDPSFAGAIEWFDNAAPTVVLAAEEINAVTTQDIGAALTAQGLTPTRVALLSRLATTPVTVVSPVTQTGDVELIRGDDYLAADGRQLVFINTSWPSLIGASVNFVVTPIFGGPPTTLPMTVADASTVTIELTSTFTAGLASGSESYRLTIVATLANLHTVTLHSSFLGVAADTEA
jgi:hypothetical protein